MRRDSNCIFCKIVAKEAPASVVYEDKNILGFLDIRPIHKGQCLLIPKEHTNHFADVDETVATRIMQIAQRLANNIRKEFNPERVGYVVAGYELAHAHFIIVPLEHAHDITSQHFTTLKDGQIHFSFEHLPLLTHEEMEAIAAKIRLE